MSKQNELINNHYRQNYKSLVKLATRRVPYNSVALAEEVVQETYTRALKYFPTFNSNIDSFDTWVKGILRNAIKDCKTQESSRGTVKEFDENDIVIPSKEDFTNLPYILKQLYTIYNISDRDYTILSMFYIYGYTSKDISIFTSVSHSNVRQIIFKFKNKIYEIHS